jgi:uncharacterized protein (TIGR03067 family)
VRYRLRTLLIVLAVTTLLWRSLVSADERVVIPTELKGKWRSLSCEMSGEPFKDCESFTWAISDERILVTENGETWTLEITRFDATTTPWQIDYRCRDPDRLFELKGIVRLEGGSLHICGVADEKSDMIVRPTEFVTRGTTDRRIMCLLSRIEE